MDLIAGVSGGSNIEYTPNMLPDGLTARISYSPKVNGSNASDKGSSGAAAASAADSGYDITLVADSAILGMEGLTLYGGISETSQFVDSAAINGDKEEQTWAVKYAMGGFTLGYQWSEEDLGRATDPKEYENTAYGVTFQINDDLSVGYSNYESEQKSATAVTAEATAISVAYTMGGASIRLADVSADNTAYQTATGFDKDGRTLSVSLAF
jgi:outer membrane protein OmpU